MLYVASDHAGFKRKQELLKALEKAGHKAKDLGPHELVPGDDYPLYAIKVAEKVAKGGKSDRGLLICDSGIGMDITANKVKGVRAALVDSAWQTERARAHNDANVIVLGAETIDKPTSLKLVELFLTTPFSEADRHERRIGEISEYEDRRD
jgi:ribose 5-phosphate isomerase B